jgi:pimeloyl-ACP methyl ester carboxylesterase
MSVEREDEQMAVKHTGTEQTGDSAVVKAYTDAPNRRVAAANGIDYAYRDVGDGAIPLVMLQHFRGNLDDWDPALIDALASRRRVVTFDNVGVGATTGTTPSSIAQMGRDAIEFIDAMGFERVDLLGFSIGSFVAQEVALTRPSLVRRLVLASSAPKGAAGMHGWAPQVIDAVGGRKPNPDGKLDVFYTSTAASRSAGEQSLKRILARSHDRDEPTGWQTRVAQYDAVCVWGIPDHAVLQRVTAIDMPVLVAAGDSDPMILPRYSYLLAGLLPGAEVEIYPDSAHGFLFQHHERFAVDVEAFLGGSHSVP